MQAINQSSKFIVTLWAGALASIVMICTKTFSPSAILAKSAPPEVQRFHSSMVKGMVATIATTRSMAGWQSNCEKLSFQAAWPCLTQSPGM